MVSMAENNQSEDFRSKPRWSANKKADAVLRLLRGESLDVGQNHTNVNQRSNLSGRASLPRRTNATALIAVRVDMMIITIRTPAGCYDTRHDEMTAVVPVRTQASPDAA